MKMNIKLLLNYQKMVRLLDKIKKVGKMEYKEQKKLNNDIHLLKNNFNCELYVADNSNIVK